MIDSMCPSPKSCWSACPIVPWRWWWMAVPSDVDVSPWCWAWS